jgi:twitching motility protein PilT
VDAEPGSPGMDSYFSAAPGVTSPLDPTWKPDPELRATDALDGAQSSMVFAPVAPPADAVSLPAVPEFVTPVVPATARVAVPLAAPVALVAPLVEPFSSVSGTSAPLLAPSGGPVLVASAPEATFVNAATEELNAAVRVGAEDTSDDSAYLADLLIEVLETGCSDLHLTVGAAPTVRHNGHLLPMEGREVLSPQFLQKLLYAILSQKQREKFEEVLELDFAYSLPGRARFRVNIYRQKDAIGAAFRLIPFEIKRLQDLGVPPAVANFAMLPRGFVLVTGPTGSGKSTTLAAVVDMANRSRKDHIMTVEDPIEFLHSHQSCLVNQREVGEDTHSFKNALKHVLRQDPDIILVGEMRDLETIEIALTAAETGHLVMATLHTQDAAQTIDRVIDVFPPHQQQQVRVQLAGTLQGVVCQQLVRTADGKGRVVATEVLIATPAIRNLIREGKTHQIYSAMQAGAKHGMATMDQHLAELVKKGKITYDAALEKCHHVEDFNRLCGRA